MDPEIIRQLIGLGQRAGSETGLSVGLAEIAKFRGQRYLDRLEDVVRQYQGVVPPPDIEWSIENHEFEGKMPAVSAEIPCLMPILSLR